MTDQAATLATVVAVAGAAPQIRRTLVTRDVAGVSVSAAALGATTECCWVAYAFEHALWSAVPEAVLMCIADVIMVTLVISVNRATAWCGLIAGAWAVALATTATLVGSTAFGIALGGAYAFQAAPAVWSVYRCATPSGVAPATWVLLGIEAIMWGIYGLGHNDPASITFALIGSVVASAILVRLAHANRAAATCRRVWSRRVSDSATVSPKLHHTH
jgi:uncharacterized protein with PQ loop repeat